MLASIVTNSNIKYPDSTDYFAPDVKYPEYPFSYISSRKNVIYMSVRETFRQAGLDIQNYNTPQWNPLGRYIRKGDNVFLLCNFVFHKRKKETINEFFAKCTHASIIRALIDYVFIACGSQGVISFGNAPIQSCDFQKVLKDTGVDSVIKFYKENNIKLFAKDLRLQISKRTKLGNFKSLESRDENDGMIVNVDDLSLLNELYTGKDNIAFRVTDYNPERIQKFHHNNYHKYVINKAILCSDVVISVPKLKTHEKVGLTVGLKGFVGIVGHKDCLAHHRFGSPKINGDEYPNSSRIQLVASHFNDFVQKRQYPKILFPLMEIIDVNFRRVLKRLFHNIQSGAWYGNDTAWRMTLDLAKIIHQTDRYGKLTNVSIRKNIVFIDGVISGEGNGPLSPTPIETGCLIFSDNIVLGDMVSCYLTGWDLEKVKLIRNSMNIKNLFLKNQTNKAQCVMNDKLIDLENIPSILGRKFIPPDGWKKILL